MASPGWTLLTNHGHVLVCVAADPQTRVRDIAAAVGVTERAVQQILHDLEEAGYLLRERVGRRNRYRIDPDARFRHPLEARVRVGQFLALTGSEPESEGSDKTASP